MAGPHQRALTPRRRVPRSFRVIRALRARGQQREVQSPCRYRPVCVLVIRVAQTTAPSTTLRRRLNAAKSMALPGAVLVLVCAQPRGARLRG